MKVFLTYGYARVTMEDIARAAEISRPALYLLFKNKADIYRAIGAALLEQSAERAEPRWPTGRSSSACWRRSTAR